MFASELKWATEQRFQFIEYHAFWLGSLNRVDLTSHFGISIPQASKDIAAYQSLYPENIKYDHSEKRYFVTKEFAPRFIELKPDVFLNGLLREANDCKETALLPTEGIPVPKRLIDPLVLQSLTECIANNQSVEVLYQSMSRSKPDAIWRRITPHSFATDGLRWHTRAYCHIDQKFKDFLLSRCLGSRQPGAPAASVHDDIFWNKSFEIRLMPNPALSASQKKVVATDYGMTDERLTVSTRMAMLYYFEKRLRLDVAHLMSDPGEYPVIIENKSAFDAAVEEATK
ncbi:WYL domain-containing protein [Paenochrobactrum pullorum]|uniref:WYL domain-containing protein n=1 Tax=Paenochrobactrum pullorum TaxID=1324351 RepID=UPI0035BC1888